MQPFCFIRSKGYFFEQLEFGITSIFAETIELIEALK